MTSYNYRSISILPKFMNSFIDFGVNVDNKQTSNTLRINNKEITIQDIPVGQKRTHYKWSNWEAFLDLVKGTDNKNLKELKKAIKLSSSAWEHTLSKVTNNVKASRIQTTAHKCHLKKDRQETT